MSDNKFIRPGSSLETDIGLNIKEIYVNLTEKDLLLLRSLTIEIINWIALKFNFDPKNPLLYINQLKQNKKQDLRAIVNMLLPYIDDDEKESKKTSLKSFDDLFVKKDSSGKYLFSNVQYNRSIRLNSLKSDDFHDVTAVERNFHPDYLKHNLKY